MKAIYSSAKYRDRRRTYRDADKSNQRASRQIMPPCHIRGKNRIGNEEPDEQDENWDTRP